MPGPLKLVAPCGASMLLMDMDVQVLISIEEIENWGLGFIHRRESQVGFLLPECWEQLRDFDPATVIQVRPEHVLSPPRIQYTFRAQGGWVRRDQLSIFSLADSGFVSFPTLTLCDVDCKLALPGFCFSTISRFKDGAKTRQLGPLWGVFSRPSGMSATES